MMTDDQLAAIEARAEAATAGPYEGRYVPDGMPINSCKYGVISQSKGVETARCWTPDDALFFSHCYADIPALVAEVRRLRGLVAAMAELVQEAYEMDSWCHDNDQIHKPLPFEQSDAAMNLNAILNGAESEGA